MERCVIKQNQDASIELRQAQQRIDGEGCQTPLLTISSRPYFEQIVCSD